MKAKVKLKELGACRKGIEWVGDMSLREAWDTCHRGDWLLWLYAKMYPDNIKERVYAAAQCSRTVQHLMKDQRSLDALDACEAFSRGEISAEELREKRRYTHTYAASSAYAASVSYGSAAYAAAAAYAAYVAAGKARKENQQKTADICRECLTVDF